VTPPIGNEGSGFGLQHLQSWLSVAGLLAAPAALVTSLCYMFGRAYYARYYGYFGIDADTIGFTNTDYVVASVSLFVDLALPLVFVSALALWFVACMRRMADVGWWFFIRLTGAFAVVAGGLLLLIPIAVALGLRGFGYMPGLGVAGTPIALGAGATLMAGGGWLIQKAGRGATPNAYRLAQRGSLVIALGAVLFSLYWLTLIYAGNEADTRARWMAANLWDRETAVEVYSRDRIAIPPLLIKESMVPGVDGQQGVFRYQCFRSLSAKGDRWVLVPAKWTPQTGYALIVGVDSSKSVVMMRLDRPPQPDKSTTEFDGQCPEVMAHKGG
jgi:hypothetical protein